MRPSSGSDARRPRSSASGSSYEPRRWGRAVAPVEAATRAVASTTRARTPSGPGSMSVAMLDGGAEVLVELRDHVERDLLGAGRGAGADVGAAAEALVVVLGDHVDHALVALGLALGQEAEVGDLGAHEERRRAVGAGGDAGAAADAGRDVEGAVGVVLGDRDR